MMKTALVLGAGGFIGNHLVNRLKDEGYWVRGADLKYPKFGLSRADEFTLCDLKNSREMSNVMFGPGQHSENDYKNAFDEVYQFAADMGGAGYIFIGDNDANVMHNSSLINLNCAFEATKKSVKKLLYSSSACIYPAHNQTDPNNPNCAEDTAYPANPDSEYGWEKLFSERLYASFARNYRLNIRIARFHNIFGPLGTYEGGKEKAPAAICRKVAYAKQTDTIDIWGDGTQTRSFLYISDCIEGVRRLMASDYTKPVNIGSNEMITIDGLVNMVASIANKNITINHIQGPVGVKGRNSDNTLIQSVLGWQPSFSLRDGLALTYNWIEKEIHDRKNNH